MRRVSTFRLERYLKYNITTYPIKIQSIPAAYSDLNIIFELPYDISRWIVMTDNKKGLSKRWVENTTAELFPATELRGSLPNYLGEMGWLRIIGVIRLGFIGPRLDACSNIISRTRSASKVLPWRGVLKLTVVRPVLGRCS